MFGKLSRDDFKFFLANLKDEISNLFEILDDREAIELLSFLMFEPANMKTLKIEYSHLDKDLLYSYIANLRDFGIIKLNKKSKYELSKIGYKFLQMTIDMLLNHQFIQGVPNSKLEEVMIRKIGKKDLEKFKEDRKKYKAEGIQLGLYISGRL